MWGPLFLCSSAPLRGHTQGAWGLGFRVGVRVLVCESAEGLREGGGAYLEEVFTLWDLRCTFTQSVIDYNGVIVRL